MPCNVTANAAQQAWEQGNAACLHGDFDLAIRHYTEALRLDPKCAKAYFSRGRAYETKGDQGKAVADYTAAIRLDPEYAEAYCNRGLADKEPALIDGGPAKLFQKAKDASTGANFFVAPNGNDHNPGTIERPFATLYKAHQWVRPGETINLRAGTYPALIGWSKSGTPTAPITVQAYNGEDVSLQSSEQYAWTRVTDPTFGDCWKVAIPYLPIQYPGVQHTVWEDAVNAAANPGIGIWAIVRGGYMCVAMNAAADFAHPQAAPGVRLADGNGNLAYDITWYDRNTKTLWFKPGPSRITDPSRQLYVTSTTSGQFSVDGSYLNLNGLKFEYLYLFHQQPNLTGCDMNDCEIKHAGGGICGGGARCTYTSLFIDKVGDWLSWRNGGYDRAYLSHCFYFNGSRCAISNCFFGRSNKGGPIQNYPYGVTENVFDSNVLYNSDGGSIFMGSSKNYITNNISLQKSYGMRPYISMQGFTFAHNYSEAAYPFGFACQEANGAYTGTFEKFTITGNVFNNTGGRVEYQGNIVDARQCKIDGNVYLGNPCWRVGLSQANSPTTKYKDCTSYASYVSALQAVPSCAAWEKKSQASSAAPRFDFASFDALLDSDPPLAAVLLKIRRYVRGVTAPFPGVGPATNMPVAGDRG